jgi:hypothetical protein
MGILATTGPSKGIVKGTKPWIGWLPRTEATSTDEGMLA